MLLYKVTALDSGNLADFRYYTWRPKTRNTMLLYATAGYKSFVVFSQL